MGKRFFVGRLPLNVYSVRRVVLRLNEGLWIGDWQVCLSSSFPEKASVSTGQSWDKKGCEESGASAGSV